MSRFTQTGLGNSSCGTAKLARLSRLAFLAALALAVFFAGCAPRSKVPEPEDPVAYYQLRVQAADHWRDIAKDVAVKVRSALLDRDDLIAKPVYVAPPPSRPFMAAFHQFLKTEMVSRGMQVSERREADTLVLKYDVLAIAFAPSRMGWWRPSGASDHEIVINARFGYNNRYVRHLSYIRYINDDDWRLYTGTDARGFVILAGDMDEIDGSSTFWSDYANREAAFAPPRAYGGETYSVVPTPGYASGGPCPPGTPGGRGPAVYGGAGVPGYATGSPAAFGGRPIDPNAPVTPLRR